MSLPSLPSIRIDNNKDPRESIQAESDYTHTESSHKSSEKSDTPTEIKSSTNSRDTTKNEIPLEITNEHVNKKLSTFSLNNQGSSRQSDNKNEDSKIQLLVEIDECADETKSGVKIVIWETGFNDILRLLDRKNINSNKEDGNYRQFTPNITSTPKKSGENSGNKYRTQKDFYKLVPDINDQTKMSIDDSGEPLIETSKNLIIDNHSPPNRSSNEISKNMSHMSIDDDLRKILEMEEGEAYLKRFNNIYTENEECAQPNVIFERDFDIPARPAGNCLFFSLIKIMNLKITPRVLRDQLLNSPYVKTCGDEYENREILESENEFGDLNCVYMFAKIYNQNVCTHFAFFTKEGYPRIIHCQCKVNNTNEYIHLYLRNVHFTPLVPIYVNENTLDEQKTSHSELSREIDLDNTQEQVHTIDTQISETHGIDASKQETCQGESSIEIANDDPKKTSEYADTVIVSNSEKSNNEVSDNENTGPTHDSLEPSLAKAMARYLTAGARPAGDRPPWLLNAHEDEHFTGVQSLDEHPFAYQTHLIYLLSADLCFDTEALNALIERGYLKQDELLDKRPKTNEVIVSDYKDFKLLGIVIKDYVDDKPLRTNMKTTIRILKSLIVKLEIKSIGIIRDLAMLSLTEWAYFVEQFNTIFKGMQITVFLYKNNLPIPRVEVRYNLIKEYHESGAVNHKGIRKTYARIANEFYWRNMRADITQFVRGCKVCQSYKLTRVKTKMPMLITDTPSNVFCKVSLDFMGPFKVTSQGNRYILSVQDSLSKFCVLIPVKEATARETARVFTDKFICYFGSPLTIITDQGVQFMSSLMEEFARIFQINKFFTTSFHAASMGSIERMHHSIKEFIKIYLTNNEEWDTFISLAQHAYNIAEHEGTGYTPHEIVYGRVARTPSSFPPREHLLTYDEFLADMVTTLCELRTMAAMNLVQAKQRSKFYYDQKSNSKHFRVGEMVYLLRDWRKGKLEPQYVGMCEIIDIDYDKHRVKIRKGNKERVVHFDKIKRAIQTIHPEDVSLDGAPMEISNEDSFGDNL